MLTTRKSLLLLATLLIMSLIVSACGGSDSDLTPTFDPNQFRTEIASTFAAQLTSTALAQPTATSTKAATPTISPLFTSTSSSLLPPPGSGGIATATQGCYRMSYVSDVTIPDNTAVTPGQSFVKTWRVRNTGSCNWDAGFKLAFTTGDAMGGTANTLSTAVTPNTEIEISINMVAPNKSGSVQGNWRMSTASGQFFGDEIYVLVNIGGATLAPTTSGGSASATPTSTATPTASPVP